MSFILVNNSEDSEEPKITPRISAFFKNRGFKIIEVCMFTNWDIIDRYISNNNILGIILSGSHLRLTNKTSIHKYVNNIVALINYPHIPILGICFGAQIMSLVYGGQVDSMNKHIFGIQKIQVVNRKSIFYKNKKRCQVYENHRDYISKAPLGFTVTAINKMGNIEVIENKSKLRFGVQFHPEYSSNTRCSILKNFILFCCNKSSSMNQ